LASFGLTLFSSKVVIIFLLLSLVFTTKTFKIDSSLLSYGIKLNYSHPFAADLMFRNL